MSIPNNNPGSNMTIRERFLGFIRIYNLDIVAIILALIAGVWFAASTVSATNVRLETIQNDIKDIKDGMKTIEKNVLVIREGRSSIDSICQNRNASISNRISRIEGKLGL